MRRVVLAAITTATLGLMVSIPGAAEACVCLQPPLALIAPADGAVNVPVNARLWMGGSYPGPRLLDASGQLVPGTVSSLRSLRGNVGIFTPDAPLTPGATYTGRSHDRQTTFTVGTVPDNTPPRVPSITSREHASSPGIFDKTSCDSSDDRLLTLGIAHKAVVTLVDIDQSSNLDPGALDGPISVLSENDSVGIGITACVHSWKGVGDIRVRLATFDVAGNFSGWSEESPEVVETVGCNCTGAAASYHGTWLLLGALGLAVISRRRARA